MQTRITALVSPFTAILTVVLTVILTVVGLCVSLGAQRGVFTHKGLGIKIRPPAKWTYLGPHGDMGSLRGIFASPREYSPRAGRGRHTPTLRVLWFPREAGAETGAKNASAVKDGIPVRVPYLSFADYNERAHGSRTRVVSRAPATFGRMKGRLHVVEVPRDAGGDLTLHTAVIQLDDGEMALEFEALREQHAKLRKTFDKSLATLITTARVKESQSSISAPPWRTDYAEWKKLSTKDRGQRRKIFGQLWLAHQKANRGEGWKLQTTRSSILIVSQADAKFNKRAAQVIDIAWPWIVKRFSGVSDDVVMPAVLRIFNSRKELTIYRQREFEPKEYQPAGREIYFFKNNLGNQGEGYADLIRGMLQQFLFDKHPLIFKNLTRWLDNGLWGYIDSYRIEKKKKLIFFASDIEMGRFAYHKKNNTWPALWELIQELIVTTPTDGTVEDRWGYTPECARMLRWFAGDGNSPFDKKDMLAAYLQQVGVSAAVAPPNPDTNVDWGRMTEQQSDELRKKVYQRRDKLLAAINNAVIPLSLEAWKRADAAFRKFNDEFER